MRKDTLYVTDLDGTLLDRNSKVAPDTVELLSSLIKQGAMFTCATARTPATVEPLFSQLPVASYTDPATGIVKVMPEIVMTGASLWNRSLKRFESVTLIPEKDAVAITAAFEKSGLRPFTYCLSGDSFLNVYHTRAMSQLEQGFYKERRHLKLKRFHLDQKPASMDRVVLFFTTGPEDVVASTNDILNAETDCAVAWYRDILNPGTGLIDIYAPGVSKARAVSDLARRVGASRVMVFGDNLNDLPMMGVADVAVAVDNAMPEVKEKADIVIGSNSENSVARFIAADR